MSDSLMWAILAALFLGPVFAGLGMVALKRFMGGEATWIEWLGLIAACAGAYRYLHK